MPSTPVNELVLRIRRRMHTVVPRDTSTFPPVDGASSERDIVSPFSRRYASIEVRVLPKIGSLVASVRPAISAFQHSTFHMLRVVHELVDRLAFLFGPSHHVLVFNRVGY